VFVEHRAVEVDAAHAVIVVRPVEPQTRAVGQINTQLAFVDLHTRDRRGELLEVRPRDVLGLRVERRDVREPGIRLLAPQSCVYEVHDAGDGLAGTPMRDNAGPTLLSQMERYELRSRAIAEINALHRAHWRAARFFIPAARRSPLVSSAACRRCRNAR